MLLVDVSTQQILHHVDEELLELLQVFLELEFISLVKKSENVIKSLPFEMENSGLDWSTESRHRIINQSSKTVEINTLIKFIEE